MRKGRILMLFLDPKCDWALNPEFRTVSGGGEPG